MMTLRPFRIAALATALQCILILSGCGQSMSDVAGVYELDKESIKAAAQAELDKEKESSDDPGDAFAASMMMNMIDQMTMTLTLNADGTASMLMKAMGEEDTSSGTWSLNGGTITISMDSSGGAPDQASGTVDGDTITLIPPEEQDMPFDLVFRKKA